MNKPLRILHIVQGMNRGGIETMLMNYYRNIDRSKIQFDFLMTEETVCDYESEIIELGGKIYRLPRISIINPIKYLVSINSFFKSHKEYVIIHSHMNAISTFPLLIGRLNGIPIRIAHSHISTSSHGIKGLLKNTLRYSLRLFTTINFACGNDAGRYLFGNTFNQNETNYLVNNAIDTEKYKFNQSVRNNIRSKLNISDNTIVIGHVGRLTKQKNHNFIIDIFKSFHERNKDSILLIIGNGELKDQIEDKIKKLGIEKNVIFTGVIPNVNEHLQAMDIFLFPSLYEGLSLSLIEAQASGLICFTSDTVDKQSKITNLVEFISLTKEAEFWAGKINRIKDIQYRINQSQSIIDAGYDIKNTSKWLEKFYFEKYNELQKNI